MGKMGCLTAAPSIKMVSYTYGTDDTITEGHHLNCVFIEDGCFFDRRRACIC